MLIMVSSIGKTILIAVSFYAFARRQSAKPPTVGPGVIDSISIDSVPEDTLLRVAAEIRLVEPAYALGDY
jgi:hypothetical protein